MKFIHLALLSAAVHLGNTHAFGSIRTSRRSTAILGYKNSATASYLDSLSTPHTIGMNARKSVVDKSSPAYLLDEALHSNATAASMVLTKINELRGPDRDAFVSNLLTEVDAPVPIWTRLRPLARCSRRARRASLRRVLDVSTPAAESGREDDEADQLRRRRRTLVIVLRSLANMYNDDDEDDVVHVADKDSTVEKNGSTANKKFGPATIVALERAARREARASSKARTVVDRDDMESRLPRGLETPQYTVVAERPQLEIRRYEPFSVCSVAMNKPRPSTASEQTDAKVSNPQLPGASSFGALAGYLFGKNQQQTAMKMTTPVLSRGEGEDRLMSFVLPSSYWNNGIENAPAPLEGSGVVLEYDDGGERAVVMFGGFASKKDVEMRTKQLLEGLRRDADWQADPEDSTVSLAQYNDPFTPPWKRRNEVSVKAVPIVQK